MKNILSYLLSNSSRIYYFCGMKVTYRKAVRGSHINIQFPDGINSVILVVGRKIIYQKRKLIIRCFSKKDLVSFYKVIKCQYFSFGQKSLQDFVTENNLFFLSVFCHQSSRNSIQNSLFSFSDSIINWIYLLGF